MRYLVIFACLLLATESDAGKRHKRNHAGAACVGGACAVSTHPSSASPAAPFTSTPIAPGVTRQTITVPKLRYLCVCGHYLDEHDPSPQSGRDCLKCSCGGFTAIPQVGDKPKYPGIYPPVNPPVQAPTYKNGGLKK